MIFDWPKGNSVGEKVGADVRQNDMIRLSLAQNEISYASIGWKGPRDDN